MTAHEHVPPGAPGRQAYLEAAYAKDLPDVIVGLIPRRSWASARLLDVKVWLGQKAHRLNSRLGVRCALCGIVMAQLPDRDVYRCESPVCNHEASATEYWHRGPITTFLGGL